MRKNWMQLSSFHHLKDADKIKNKMRFWPQAIHLIGKDTQTKDQRVERIYETNRIWKQAGRSS